ncbi:hypothetical protein EBR21_17670 [bacterium]|nr:hypothetical protein [bacterium]
MKIAPALKISLLDSALFRGLTIKPETLRYVVEGRDLHDLGQAFEGYHAKLHDRSQRVIFQPTILPALPSSYRGLLR